MDRLSRLPAEILQGILDFLPPDSLFFLASTCQKLYGRLYDLVQAQRRFADLYSSVDDRHPLNLITTLRRVLTDRDAAWHLRSINIYSGRRWLTQDIFVGTDDIKYLKEYVENPKIHSSDDCKYIYHALRRRWRDLSHLTPSDQVDPEHRLFSESELEVILQLTSDLGSECSESQVRNGNERYLLPVVIACAPRLREVWFAQSTNGAPSCGPNLQSSLLRLSDGFADRRLLRLSGTALGYVRTQGNPDAQKWSSSDIPPGFQAVRYVDLGEATVFVDYRTHSSNIEATNVNAYLNLPNLELLRFTRNLEYTGTMTAAEDGAYVFEWEPKKGALRETLMSFTIRGAHPGIYRFRDDGPMKQLSTRLMDCILSYECDIGTAEDVQALYYCAGQSLESLTFTGDTPWHLGGVLAQFSKLKKITIGINYFIQHYRPNSKEYVLNEVLLPTSLEHLMVHGEKSLWRNALGEQISDYSACFISRLLQALKFDQVPNLKSICIVQTWGNSPPGSLAALVGLVAQRGIDVHLWSGSPEVSTRTCPHLCGRYVSTSGGHHDWPSGPREWNYYSTFNWVTLNHEDHYGERWKCQRPQYSDEKEAPANILQEWNNDFFRKQLRELYSSRADGRNLSNTHLDLMTRGHFDRDMGLKIRDEGVREQLIEKLAQVYNIDEFKKQRIDESIALGRKVVDSLGGVGGRLVCKEFRWQRIFD